MQSFEHICDRPIPLSPMTLDNYSQSIVLILTKNLSTIVIVTDFQIGNAYSSIAFLYQHEIKRTRSCMCIACHCQRVPTFAHQLHDSSKLMSSDSPCNFYSRVTRMCDMSDISRMTNNTAYISLLPLEFPLKSLDLYRISPNIPQTLCHPSKGEIVPLN